MIHKTRLRAITIVGRSGTGKTTLLIKLVKELTGRNYRVGCIKHNHSNDFEIDHEGKDSWLLTQAGVATMMVVSPTTTAMVKKNLNSKEPSLADTLEQYFPDMDLIFIEGYKSNPFPKIEIFRKECNASLLCRQEKHDPSLIAVASDQHLELDVPVFNLDDINGICDFIVDYIRCPRCPSEF
jgi:molybdopterin-guanine dinucleotide biosynthesis protein MobB